MASIIKASINLSEIPKNKIIAGKKGQYLPITITLNDEVDQFGNQGPIQVEQSIAERDAKVAKVYLGNVKVVWTNGTNVPAANTTFTLNASGAQTHYAQINGNPAGLINPTSSSSGTLTWTYSGSAGITFQSDSVAYATFTTASLTLTGVVDTDAYPLVVLFPFMMKNTFEGVIEKGTPVVQIIPFKREDWKKRIYDKISDKSSKELKSLGPNFRSRNVTCLYKSLFISLPIFFDWPKT
jgi:hypothetical protein